MNSEQKQRLERDIDRALKSLPEIQAPEHLLSRVMARIEATVAKPWYQRSWPEWPAPARFGSLFALALIFAGFCYAYWIAPEARFMQPLLARLQSLANVTEALWSVLGAIAGLIAGAFRQAGTGVLVGCAAMVFLGYALCVGLGTVYFRVALARR
jgi:hypothetical protein